jgi:hypothetical protein
MGLNTTNRVGGPVRSGWRPTPADTEITTVTGGTCRRGAVTLVIMWKRSNGTEAPRRARIHPIVQPRKADRPTAPRSVAASETAAGRRRSCAAAKSSQASPPPPTAFVDKSTQTPPSASSLFHPNFEIPSLSRSRCARRRGRAAPAPARGPGRRGTSAATRSSAGRRRGGTASARPGRPSCGPRTAASSATSAPGSACECSLPVAAAAVPVPPGRTVPLVGVFLVGRQGQRHRCSFVACGWICGRLSVTLTKYAPDRFCLQAASHARHGDPPLPPLLPPPVTCQERVAGTTRCVRACIPPCHSLALRFM